MCRSRQWDQRRHPNRLLPKSLTQPSAPGAVMNAPRHFPHDPRNPMVHPAAGQFRAQGPMPSGPYYGAPNGAAQSQFPQSPPPNSPYFGPPPQGPPPTGDAPKAGGSRKRTVIAAAAAMALLAGGGAAAYFSLTAPAPGYQPLSYAGPVPFTAPVGADNPAINTISGANGA